MSDTLPSFKELEPLFDKLKGVTVTSVPFTNLSHPQGEGTSYVYQVGIWGPS